MTRSYFFKSLLAVYDEQTFFYFYENTPIE